MKRSTWFKITTILVAVFMLGTIVVAQKAMAAEATQNVGVHVLGNGQVEVNWQGQKGTVTVSTVPESSGCQAEAGEGKCVLKNLTIDHVYTFKVKVNEGEEWVLGEARAVLTPVEYLPPSSVEEVYFSKSEIGRTVFWQAVQDIPVTVYTVYSNSGLQCSSVTTSCTLAENENEVFYVTASNDAGISARSSVAVEKDLDKVTATPGNGQITFSWLLDNGRKIVKENGEAGCQGEVGQLTCVVKGLVNGVWYSS